MSEVDSAGVGLWNKTKTMSNLTDAEIKTLKKCSEDKWDKVCDEIQSAHGGKYPDDWFQIVVSGKIIPVSTIKIISVKHRG